jgi:hypothetical protein
VCVAVISRCIAGVLCDLTGKVSVDSRKRLGIRIGFFLEGSGDGEFYGGTSHERHADRSGLGYEHRDLRHAKSGPWVRVALDSNLSLVFADASSICCCVWRMELFFFPSLYLVFEILYLSLVDDLRIGVFNLIEGSYLGFD